MVAAILFVNITVEEVYLCFLFVCWLGIQAIL